jgi:hypothetical protein
MVKHWTRARKEDKGEITQYSLVKTKGYLSFLLRLWRVRQNEGNGWRASLEDPHTGEVRSFASLELLWDFLCEQTHSAGKQTSEYIEREP